jgi:hypothetical protein
MGGRPNEAELARSGRGDALTLDKLRSDCPDKRVSRNADLEFSQTGTPRSAGDEFLFFDKLDDILQSAKGIPAQHGCE